MAFDAPPPPNAGNLPDKPREPRPSPPDASGSVTLGEQYVISTREAAPALNGPGRTAWRATDRRHPSEPYAALICTGETTPRIEVMRAMRGITRPGMLSIYAHGAVDWPGGPQRLAVVCAAPQGGRFTLTRPFAHWQIVDSLLRPATAALMDLHNRSVAHRAIWPGNLFLREAGGHTLSLGPCVTSPAGYDTPAIFEPLDSAAADPAGRGEGSPRHDMFALGMTALALHLGRIPGAELHPDDLMIRRLEVGSMAAVVDRRTLPRELVDVLHGLMADDESDRWSLGDLHQWLNAGRPKPPPLREPLLATAPYAFAGRQVRTARALSHLMARNWTIAAAALHAGDLSRWVHDYAPERIASSMLEHSLTERDPEGESAGDGDALTVARAVTALDPNGPVRYRDIALDPHGLGPLLPDVASNTERRAALMGVLRYGLIQRTLDRRTSERRTANTRRATRQAIDSERVKRWVSSTQPWEGFERCLYELNAGLTCQSPLVNAKWISTAPELVSAMDQAALSGAWKDPQIDGSLAAFLASRHDVDSDALMCLMKPDEADDEGVLSALRMFAELQQTMGSPPLPGLAAQCAKLARRIADTIHHRPTRQALLEAIDRATPMGSAAAILRTVEITGLRPRDDAGFASARTMWAQIEYELRGVTNGTEARRARAWTRGRDNIAFAAAAASVFAFLGTFFLGPGK